jgi:hypothetical protein
VTVRLSSFSMIVVLSGLTLAAPSLAAAMCTSDADCKGARICDMGNCKALPMSGAGERAAAGSSFGRPSWFRVYGEHALVLAFHGWGGISAEGANHEDDLDADFMPGTRFAGYYAASEGFHIGGFFSVMGGEVTREWRAWPGGWEDDVTVVNLGLAMKIGKRISDRIWLGMALDVGLTIWGPDIMDTFVGFHFNPLFNVEVMLLAKGKFRLGLYSTFGPMFTPIAATEWQGVDVTGWMVNLAMAIGITVGVGH